MIIDATDSIAGRLAAIVAKKAMLGEGIVILNAEKAVVSGTKIDVLFDAKKNFDRGIPTKGPFIPKLPDRYLRRIIRGMLPYKQPKGKDAYNRVKCYVGVPGNFSDQKIEVIESVNVKKIKRVGHVTIRDICRHLGGKI